MVDINCWKVWLHFPKYDADYARCSICDAVCKARGENTSNIKKHLKRFPTTIQGGRPANKAKRITACSNSMFMLFNVIRFNRLGREGFLSLLRHYSFNGHS
ncbi:hypothetical protein AMECASPLE_026101 [Ameca splendens]|uniref:BED-type domain-containing protein n=1 Tax=Ameca splendens TaxID=208324 RepID=A0ABV0YRT2_9TELE